VVEGTVLGGAFVFRLLTRNCAVGKRVEIDFVLGVSELAQISMGAVLYPSARDRAVASAWHRQVGKFSLRFKERSAELADGVGMPAQLETFADVFIFVGCPEDLGGASDDLVGLRHK